MKFSGIESDFANRKVFLSLKNVRTLTLKGVTNSFNLIGKSLIKTARKGILDKKNKTGKIYIVLKNGELQEHQASAGGEYPANLSGSLESSLGYEGANSGNRLEFGAGGRESKVRKNKKLVKYAKYLEEGTSNSDGSPRMASRPFLKMAIESNYRNIENYIGNSVVDEIKK